MKKFLAFNFYEVDYEFCDTEEECVKWCNEEINFYKDELNDVGFDDLKDMIGYAEVKNFAVEKVKNKRFVFELSHNLNDRGIL